MVRIELEVSFDDLNWVKIEIWCSNRVEVEFSCFELSWKLVWMFRIEFELSFNDFYWFGVENKHKSQLKLSTQLNSKHQNYISSQFKTWTLTTNSIQTFKSQLQLNWNDQNSRPTQFKENLTSTQFETSKFTSHSTSNSTSNSTST